RLRGMGLDRPQGRWYKLPVPKPSVAVPAAWLESLGSFVMRSRLDRTPWAALALIALSPAVGWTQAQTAGGEFRVNTYTQNYQYARANAVGMSADGRFVIVWGTPQDG